MAVPTAPTEAGGDKVLFLTHDVGGTNTPGIFRGVVPRTVNGTVLSYAGIATHADAQAFVSGDPVVLAGVWEAGSPGTVRKMLGDASGRVVVRPPGAYDAGGGANGFGHPTLVAKATVNGEDVGWLGVGSHADGATYSGTQPVTVIGGVYSTTAKKAISDSDGRLITDRGHTFGGNGHQAVTGSVATALRSTTACRKVLIKADSTNAGVVYVGIASVTANTTGNTGGFQMAPTDPPITVEVADLASVYIHGTNGYGVSYLWWT